MMRNLFSLFAGTLFGLGLLGSGMTDTLKVQGFLDLFGEWDPSLIFVMGGAIIPMVIAWMIAMRRETTLLNTPMPTPAKTEINKPLVIGAVMFGMGWGLSGFCPGPAMASITFGGLGGIVFLGAMLMGMYIFPKIDTVFHS
jgi:uncharacterized membrane protein YedE/YeeE